MIIGRNYLLKKGPGPSSPKLLLDTRVVPAIVNMAGAAEGAVERASRHTGVRPAVLLAGAAGLLALCVARWARRQGR